MILHACLLSRVACKFLLFHWVRLEFRLERPPLWLHRACAKLRQGGDRLSWKDYDTLNRPPCTLDNLFVYYNVWGEG